MSNPSDYNYSKHPDLVPVVNKSETAFKIYGREWQMPQWTPLGLELFAYKNRLGPNEGFVDAEYHFRKAFAIMYPKFQMHEWVDLELWAYCNFDVINVIGHTRASKTFTFAFIEYLDYCAAPLDTIISLTTVTFPGLKDRMWSDMMNAVQSARLPSGIFKVNSSSNDLSITNAPDPALSKEENFSRQKFQIKGMATSKQKDSAARIQGMHSPRRIIVEDEAQGLPDAIFEAEKNLQSAKYSKVVRLANPEDRWSTFGRLCEPENGWESVTDSDLVWKTKHPNSVCLHLDGFQCHNVKLHHKLANGEITQAQYDDNVLAFQPDYKYFSSLDPDTLAYWKYAKGYFPPDGLILKVFSDSFLMSATREPETFIYGGVKIACMDPAFEHDDCVLQIFEYGRKKNGLWHVNCISTHKLVPKMGGAGGRKPKDYQLATMAKEVCIANRVEPKNFIMDKSGNGRGVYAIMQVEWDEAIQGCEFGGKASDRLLREGDPQKCNEKYAYFVDELWFRAAEWMRYGDVTGIHYLDSETKDDLSSRYYDETNTSLLKVEKKKDMKARIGKSPDFGDAFCLFAELLARNSIIPGLKDSDGVRAKGSNKSALDRAKRVNQIYEDEFSQPEF
jgi:hypothetical protein